MISVVVSIRVVPDQRERFLTAIRADAEASMRVEPGCVGFDVSEDVEEPNHFVLYESYRDLEAVEAHRATPHYADWREEAAACLVPGSQVLHKAQIVLRRPEGPQ